MENETLNEKKDTAKTKIILFIIGVLVGAVISTTAFLVYVKTLGIGSSTSNSSQQMPSGTPPEMPSGDGSSNTQNGTPPEMPNNNSSSNTQGNAPSSMPGNAYRQNS